MQCPRCQHDNLPAAKFCQECATPLACSCTNCGSQLPPSAKFCPECAHPAGAVATSPGRFPAPESYTPKHLAEKILTSKAALEGERKQVTVLFADLKGSMELLADRDPEEARKLLDPVLEHMMEAVHRYEGTVNQVMGDGIMALFGAPLAHEDHAVRACYAALRMQESVKRYAEGVFRSFGVPIQIRVGLNSGDVVVRAIGSDLHMDYTAVGQSTHLAARMEQMAQPGTTLLTPETLALAEGFVQVTSRGPVPVKGMTAPIEIFELAGASPVRSRLHAAASRGLTRFVGRDAEIELLRQALGRAGEGHGQLVAVVGEPGVGKSRLVWEFTHSHRSRGWLVLEAASVSYGKATTYFPVIELLRSYFGIEPRDDGRKMREKVTGKLLSLDRALEPALPVFLSLLDVRVEDPEWATLDPAQRRRQTLEALKRLLVRESQVQPVLLVVEDLHWIDGDTQAWLDLLVESLPTARLLLLTNYRPEYSHGWGSKTYYQQVRLDTLPAASAGELLEALLGTGPGLADLERLLIERTQGNPFFLEESVRALVETRALTGERGAYRLAGPIKRLQLPATAHAILAARIDRLTPGDKRLLQAAAVVGKDVPFPLLQAIAEESEEGVRETLARLQAAEFLYEARLFPELEYTFKHALTHEVTYGGLLQDRRSALHARLVEAMEQLHADHLDEHVERLAHHAVRGEVWNKAVPYCQQAGARAHDRAAFGEAVAHFEQALQALAHLPEDGDTRVLALDLRLALVRPLNALGGHERRLALLGEAETLARALDDRARLGRVLANVAFVLRQTGDSDGAIAAGQQALALAAALGDSTLQGQAFLSLGMAYYGIGDFGRAAELLRRNVEAADRESGTPSTDVRIQSRAWLARTLSALGAFAEGRRHGEEALRLATLEGRGQTPIVAHGSLGELYLAKGDLEHAVRVLDQGLALCRASGHWLWLSLIAAALGYAAALQGRLAEGRALLEEAVSVTIRTGVRFNRARWVAWLSEVCRLAGHGEEAWQHARQALDLARQQKERADEALALHQLGVVYAHADPPDVEQAAARYQQALALATDLGMRPLVAHCHLGLGKLYRRTGKRQEAHEHLTTAATLYREMDIRVYLQQAEAELASDRPIVGQTDGP
jgi:class 3 adenylate cyclase/tetratricopeptide (TPR) repeat protein